MADSGRIRGVRLEFGWVFTTHTHRVEPMEGGGAILWIDDRCFIVMYA